MSNIVRKTSQFNLSSSNPKPLKSTRIIYKEDDNPGGLYSIFKFTTSKEYELNNIMRLTGLEHYFRSKVTLLQKPENEDNYFHKMTSKGEWWRTELGSIWCIWILRHDNNENVKFKMLSQEGESIKELSDCTKKSFVSISSRIRRY